MNTDGSGLTQLTTMDTNDDFPIWSPDGTKIVFGSQNQESGISDIYVMNADGSGLTRLLSSASLPDW
jgi:TolB protein